MFLTILFWLFVVIVVLLICFITVIFLGVRHRQANRPPDLDLTGETYRTHLKQLGKELKDFDPYPHLGFDPMNNLESLERFSPIKYGTQCIFAKSSRLWGSRDWDTGLTLEENVARNAKALELFLEAGKGLHFDGFLIEIRGVEHSRDLESFSDAVRRALTVLSDLDPKGVRCMSKSYIDKRGWWFEFANEPMFVTSFAPFYPKHSPRYAFEIPKDSCFILLQPEYSFAWRDIEDDKTKPTMWDNPESARDKVRLAFRNAGRNYIEDESHMKNDPIGAHQIVRPIEISDTPPQWWKRKL